MEELSEGIELHYVETVEEADSFLRWLGGRRPILAIDTETTGLQWWTPNFTRLVQFGDAMQGWTLSIEKWKGLADIAMSRIVEAWEGPPWYEKLPCLSHPAH